MGFFSSLPPQSLFFQAYGVQTHAPPCMQSVTETMIPAAQINSMFGHHDLFPFFPPLEATCLLKSKNSAPWIIMTSGLRYSYVITFQFILG